MTQRHLCETCALVGERCPKTKVGGAAGTVISGFGRVLTCDEFTARTWPQEKPTMPAESHDPDHYKGDIECIDAMRAASTREEFVAYCRLTAMKYCWRFGKKDDAVMEARKAGVYLRWAQQALEGKPLTKG